MTDVDAQFSRKDRPSFAARHVWPPSTDFQTPAPLTLAFLPYAPKLDEDAKLSLEKGHELIIHTPMEPMNGKMNPGPIALMNDMNETQLNAVLDEVFS